jgi:predicted AlkP superfamily pyrophosphatase or phosphodiesterase
VGYGPLREAFEATSDHVERAGRPTYTYLYFSHVDAAAHEYGIGSPEAHGALIGIDAGLSRLANHLGGRARIVVTSDHGHAEVPEEQRHRLRSTDPIAAHFRVIPSGDMRAPSFHLLPGHAEAFAEEFRARYGTRFVLLTPGEIEALELLGPGALSEETRRRLGDFVALSLGIDVLGFIPADGNRRALQQPSHHSGLTAAEMYVPLVVA